jgi:hypothetical protein
MKKSAREVADKLEEIAMHVRVTGKLDSLKYRELNTFVQTLGQEMPKNELGDYFSPEQIEDISKLSAVERIKLAYRLDEGNAKKSVSQDASDKAA